MLVRALLKGAHKAHQNPPPRPEPRWQSQSSTFSRSASAPAARTPWGPCAPHACLRCGSLTTACCRPPPACTASSTAHSAPPAKATAATRLCCWAWPGMSRTRWTPRPFRTCWMPCARAGGWCCWVSRSSASTRPPTWCSTAARPCPSTPTACASPRSMPPAPSWPTGPTTRWAAASWSAMRWRLMAPSKRPSPRTPRCCRTPSTPVPSCWRWPGSSNAALRNSCAATSGIGAAIQRSTPACCTSGA